MLRNAERIDVPAILGLIQELATFEKEPNAVVNTEDELAHSLFDEKHCHALVWEDPKYGVIAFALYYFGYSTWKGKTVYLEDLYVKQAFRQQKIGVELFLAVVEIAKKNKVRRMDWQVLEWNQPAIDFYRKQHATLDSEWINGRLFFDSGHAE
jgi:GNAT superfamily N-acetyltransferase